MSLGGSNQIAHKLQHTGNSSCMWECGPTLQVVAVDYKAQTCVMLLSQPNEFLIRFFQNQMNSSYVCQHACINMRWLGRWSLGIARSDIYAPFITTFSTQNFDMRSSFGVRLEVSMISLKLARRLSWNLLTSARGIRLLIIYLERWSLWLVWNLLRCGSTFPCVQHAWILIKTKFSCNLKTHKFHTENLISLCFGEQERQQFACVYHVWGCK